jgi:zinc protease
MIPPRPLVALTAAVALLAGSCTPDARTGTEAASPASAPDPLGPKPVALATPAFEPDVPVRFAGPHGITVLLMERHALPLVAVSAVVPYGAASEPSDRPGLAHVAAQMIDQGAGAMDAVAYAQALDDLGVELTASVDRDTTTVAIDCLAARLPEALPLLLAAIARPHHGDSDFARVSALWRDDLRQRQDEPRAVASLVATAATHGADTPYGHPLQGTLESAATVTLAQVDAWHRAIWRPDAATFVVVGDVTRQRLEELLAQATADWQPAGAAPPAIVAPAQAPPARARTIVVDRPDAPQVVVCLARATVTADDPALPRLALANVALGGSFTSRLMQSLREDHGWTYGVRSKVGPRRGPGMFAVHASIRTDALSPALREMRAIIADVAERGITADELAKSRSQVQADLVESYGTVAHLAAHFASNAGIGLDPAIDRAALAAQRTATLADVGELARRYIAADAAALVLVGPKAPILQAIADNGLPAAECCDADGRPIAASDAHE